MRLRLFASQAGLAIGVLAAVTIVSAEILPQTAGPVGLRLLLEGANK